ncbi:cation efflux protein [Gorgonomyces haynaldii]|nr:cation efflux protein [Gorgonomyces haynaldii]
MQDTNPARNDYRKRRLLFAILFCFILFAAEFVGGIFADSIAILSDSFHMLSDVLGYIISYAAIYFASKQKTKQFGFGYQRIEVLGALASIGLVWLLTFGLVTEAVERLYHPHHIRGKPMLYMSIAGVVVNCILIFVFGHEEGEEDSPESSGLVHDLESEVQKPQGQDLNIRAAMLHAIGDLLSSVGVLISALVIVYKPEYQWVDPLCTFVFGFMAIATTLGIIRDIFYVLMQSCPSHISVASVENELRMIQGVHAVRDIQIWALTMTELCCSCTLRVSKSLTLYETTEIVSQAKVMLLQRYGITKVTIETDF